MAAIKRRDTGPELAIRSILHAAGLRYRVDLRLSLKGGSARPDLVFTRKRIAVFIDGCFWHVCPDHGRQPRLNDHYWGPKLRRNVERDREADALLSEAGWKVIRVWEHQEPSQAAATILQAVGAG